MKRYREGVKRRKGGWRDAGGRERERERERNRAGGRERKRRKEGERERERSFFCIVSSSEGESLCDVGHDSGVNGGHVLTLHSGPITTAVYGSALVMYTLQKKYLNNS